MNVQECSLKHDRVCANNTKSCTCNFVPNLDYCVNLSNDITHCICLPGFGGSHMIIGLETFECKATCGDGIQTSDEECDTGFDNTLGPYLIPIISFFLSGKFCFLQSYSFVLQWKSYFLPLRRPRR
eukprot:TRINITY_DN8498_c0_g1_i14.p1 TRINITY_DN8498_c0_g1~~TRINITY_DN8498_c0_g1_i14.p1  ORF type:complete len:126 (-),score=16.71 TRINITY_DN8498_c0_g1_i14:345-722(-)